MTTDRVAVTRGKHREFFSQNVLDFGFRAAVILAGLCLVISVSYLVVFLMATNNGISALLRDRLDVPDNTLKLAMNARMVMAKIALLSCGVLGGLSFGFLGFALFLIGVKGEMDTEFETPGAESLRVKIARLSPGVFVIMCATILIGYCSTKHQEFGFTPASPTADPSSQQEIPDVGDFEGATQPPGQSNPGKDGAKAGAMTEEPLTTSAPRPKPKSSP